MFRLHYHLSNNGDGSASVRIHPTKAEAVAADESMEEGWGESSAGHIDLKMEDGKLLYGTYDYVDGKYQKVWKSCEVRDGE